MLRIRTIIALTLAAGLLAGSAQAERRGMRLVDGRVPLNGRSPAENGLHCEIVDAAAGVLRVKAKGGGKVGLALLDRANRFTALSRFFYAEGPIDAEIRMFDDVDDANRRPIARRGEYRLILSDNLETELQNMEVRGMCFFAVR